MKTKNKSKAARRTPRVPTPAQDFAVLVEIRDSLGFISEAMNRQEVRHEKQTARVKTMAKEVLALGGKLGVLPADLVIILQAAFADENQN